jgi:hypothetical protein
MPDLNSVLTLSSGLKASELSGLGVTGAALGITPASLGVKSMLENQFQEVTDGTRFPYHIPTIYTINNRTPTWSGAWNTGDGWGTYYNSMRQGAIDMERNFHMALGRHNRQNTTSYSSLDNRAQNVIQWAKGNVVGGGQVHNHMEDSSYQGFSMRSMFIRNFHPTLSKTITMSGWYANYWAQGYEGSSMYYGIPTNSSGTNYSTANGMTWTNMINREGGNSNYTWTANMTIPPQKTAFFCQTSTYLWWQGGYGGKALEVNKLYDLQTTFSDKWIQPDMRMTMTAHNYADLDDTTFNGYTSHRLWNRCATIYGDR